MKVRIRIKNVYGTETIYPACPVAEIFAKLVRQKTLTLRDLNLIKQLGYTIEVLPTTTIPGIEI